jgi:hypothetical protein
VVGYLLRMDDQDSVKRILEMLRNGEPPAQPGA